MKNSKYENIKLQTRYVDDILILWKGTDGQVDQFVTETNNINKDIHLL